MLDNFYDCGVIYETKKQIPGFSRITRGVVPGIANKCLMTL
jgi:hypothetical protein